MNRQLYRLVFDRRRGMRIAVAECARSCGKTAAAGATLAVTAAASVLAATPAAPPAPARPPVVFSGAQQRPAPTASLPRPYGSTFKPGGTPVNATPRAFAYDPAKGANSADLSTTGQVSWTVDGNTATFDQGNVARVVINWDSFDIGANHTVRFLQNKDPSVYVSALNRIWSADPSVILGSLKADREVILLNANGVYFGRGARVDTGRFVASALNIADSVFEKGLRNVTDGSAAFLTGTSSGYTATNLDAGIGVEAGAEIASAAGGDVLLIAPRVVNQGRIVTPQGQAVLAAGDKVYLMSSSDPKQRGLIVAVDPVLDAQRRPDATLGVVENAARGSTDGLVDRINEIRADSGSVNLVGLTVRQNGVINATTAVKGANGAIYLQAMASTSTQPLNTVAAAERGYTIETGAQLTAARDLGTVEIGAGSITAVAPASSATTQIDAEVFNASRIRIEGAAISVGTDARITAPGGQISLVAAESVPGNNVGPFYPDSGLAAPADASRIVIAPGARISAAGEQGVAVSGERNQGSLRLFRIELADSPVQRSGPLYRSQVYFDLRDGSKVTLANVAGATLASVTLLPSRTARERATAGGTIDLVTGGTVVLGEGATLDVSGGSLAYSATTLQQSLLLQDGRLIGFRSGAGGSAVQGLASLTQALPSPAYTEGAAGGSLHISGRNLALGGQLLGHTVLGERQRDGRSVAATPSTLRLGDGSSGSFQLARLRLSPAAAEAPDAAIFAAPLTADLSGIASGLDLSLAQVAAGGFGALRLRATEVTQLVFGTLDLGIGGSLDIAANRLSLDGAFSAPGGRIALATELGVDAGATGRDLRLSAATVLDAAGRFTNDTHADADGGGERAAVAGGSVSVASAGSLFVAAGATLDVSGGAKLAADGSLTKGKAGALTLATGSNEDQALPTLQIDGARLRGLDFTGGGQLTLGVPSLTIGGSGGDGGAGFSLEPGFFGSSGFGSIRVNSLGDVRVASGTQLAPRMLNWEFAPGWRAAHGGAMTPDVVAPVRLDESLVTPAPVNLAFAAQRSLQRGGADLIVERGASIDLDPAARLSLTASDSVIVGAGGGQAGQDTRLSAPGGEITLAISGRRGTDDADGFVPTQAIWLGSSARLAVDGVALLRPDGGARAFADPGAEPAQATQPSERQTGAVLGGGVITLNAARGYVVAEAGSSLSLNGAAANVNIAGRAEPVRVAASAGQLKVSTLEGFAIESRVSARAPQGGDGQPVADGGRLDLAIGRGGVFLDTTGRPFDPTPRSLSIGDWAGLLARSGAAPGSDLSQTLLGNGRGFVTAALLTGAGFGSVTLAAGQTISFEKSLQLVLPQSLALEAPAIAAAPSVQIVLQAAQARLGEQQTHVGEAPDTRAQADTSPQHDTALSVSTGTIEVIGNLGLQGFSTVHLDTSTGALGEIRFSALNPNYARVESLSRQLAFAGELQLTAAQIYATTATQYTLLGLADADSAGAPGGSVTVRSPGGAPPRPPLSVLGSLAIRAGDIDQGGVLRQPFGRIELIASRRIRLGEGSTTSVSGDGVAALYGESLNLAIWKPPSLQGLDALPIEKGITLNAPQIDTAPSARVDASGGGSLLAWEFFPGVGGSRDVLNTEGLYAVLPDYAAVPALSADGSLLAQADAKQFVVTMAGSGLAPGRYTLLPARLALLGGKLPAGAFLVSRAANQGSAELRAPIVQDDGSVVVTGFFSGAGSVLEGAPGQRFVIEPMATFNARSDIRLTEVGALLSARAATLGNAAPLLPGDAGAVRLALTGNDGSRWTAALDLAGHGGRAGTLDVDATRIALLDDPTKAAPDALALDARVIADSAAGSVLLGGTRTAVVSEGATPTWQLTVGRAREVIVDSRTQPLVAEELLLAARERVAIAEGTHIEARGTGSQGARTLRVSGDGAVVALSTNQLTLDRSGSSGAAGRVELGAGAMLAGPQLLLDAAASIDAGAGVQLSAGALTIGARDLVIGAAAGSLAGATVIDGDLLAQVRAAQDLTLRGYRRIDFAGVQDWSQRPASGGGDALAAPTAVQRRLVLDTPQLRGVADTLGGIAAVDISAQELLLRNSGAEAANAPAGSGSLLLQALPPLRAGITGGLTIGPGVSQLGFDSAALRSLGDLVLSGAGGLQAQGDLTLAGARVTAGSGAEQAVAAGGTLRVAAQAGSRTLGERAGQGANVSLSGATVRQEGRIELPGGLLTIAATGDAADTAAVSFGAGSLTSVAGFALTPLDGFTAYGAAGRIDVRAAGGRIDLLGTLDASAAAAGDAGRIALAATGAGGELRIGAMGRIAARAGQATGDRGGTLQVDVQQMLSADALAQAAADGGATGQFSLRVRSGDVALQRGVTAQRIEIAADGGSLAIGTATPVVLDARAPAGGVVQLAAQGDLLLGAGARIEARSSREGANGGDVLLASSEGRLRVDSAATVEAGGDDTQDGRIVLRAQRDDSTRNVRIDALNAANLRAAAVDIEAVRTYDGVQTLAAFGDFDGQLSQATVRRDTDAFMTGKAALLTTLGLSGPDAARFNLRAGVEVRSDGDLTLQDDWQFAGTPAQPNRDRPGGDAGFLTLRAAGNLWLAGSLLDGFTTAGVISDNRRSWSYRLVGGADLTAANPLSTVNLAAAPDETGNVVLDAGKLVRTGAGSIEIAAGRDVSFTDPGDGSAAASVVVAGRKLAQSAELLNTLFRNQLATPSFTEQGGRLEVSAQRDVTAPEATQLIGNWLWRGGLLSSAVGESGLYVANNQLAWWTQQAQFGQTLGSIGGGSLRVEAGRDVINVQAMAPSAGWADSRVAAQAGLHVIDGGDVAVHAGRDLLGGQFLLGRGEGRLEAGRDIGTAGGNAWVMQPILALQDGVWRATARGGVELSAPFDPTAAAAALAGGRSTVSPFFWTWSPESALKVTANSGTVRLSAGLASDVIENWGLNGSTPSSQMAYQVQAPSLEVTAAGGAIDLDGLSGGSLLYPSPTAHLRLWAGTDLRLGATASAQLVMSASAPASWGPSSAPLSPFALEALLGAAFTDRLPLTNLHAGDAEPALLHAQGSVLAQGRDAGVATLMVPKPAQISAGRDIVELSLRAQNLSDDDVTTISAGRNVLAGTLGRVEVAGPGALEVSAGGSIDLGSSAGLSTTGNLRNGALPAEGASIRVMASRVGMLDLSALDAQFLRPAADGGSERFQQYRDALVSFVAGELKQEALDYEQAHAAFASFDGITQARFGRQVLAAEFGATYLSGAAPTAAQFTEDLRAAFERRKAQVLQAGDDALTGGGSLTLPGRQVLQGAALASYLNDLRRLNFASLTLDSVVAHRVASLQAVQGGWREAVAHSLGGSVQGFEDRARQNPNDAGVLAYRGALATFSGSTFERYRAEVMARETNSAGAEASNFGVRSLPVRLALFDQGFQAAELAGAGSFVAQPIWPAARTQLFTYGGTLDMTQSSVITRRGGGIALVNAGGAINVGLKDNGVIDTSTPKGVIALGGGDVFGFAKGDFQVNNQRVFIVGSGNMTIWSSSGDIDSGRGANTAVAAPPLQARRGADGIVFEVPPTTTGSGLGILEDALGRRSGTIGLYPAFGEILALDAFIRAPALVLGSTVKGADNLIAPSVGGAAAAVSAPALSVAPPAAAAAETRGADAAGGARAGDTRARPSLLTVELLGIGAAADEPPCEERDATTGKCLRPARPR